ncbi:MAG: 50S ribosomal protein L35 [Candidatus Shapirobacteria bacterium]|nr:50S ribosomal protein L35 [Candidatus Shapirobacteria bacterium]
MTKQKTKKSLAKRFRVTPSGKVLHQSAFGRHLKKSKSKTQKGKYKKPKEITGTMAKKIKKVLGK